MAHVIVTTSNGHEAFFKHGQLIHSSSPQDSDWSAAAEGAVSAAEDGISPSRVFLRKITGDTVPDWEQFRRDYILPECEGIEPDEPDPSDLMNLPYDDDGQYGM
ncbi:hypothetical protein MWH03_00255 [Klebsiella pneumoniae]|nr:hypothetical protein [Klebsiella pneumoniae]